MQYTNNGFFHSHREGKILLSNSLQICYSLSENFAVIMTEIDRVKRKDFYS